MGLRSIGRGVSTWQVQGTSCLFLRLGSESPASCSEDLSKAIDVTWLEAGGKLEWGQEDKSRDEAVGCSKL